MNTFSSGGGGNSSRSSQCHFLSVFILCFPLFSAPPRLQLILYSAEEVRAALEPLRAIPAFTQLLLTDPPATPKRKGDKPAGKDKPIGASDPATPAVPIETGKDQDQETGAASG